MPPLTVEGGGKKLFKVGVSFAPEKCNIGEWKVTKAK